MIADDTIRYRVRFWVPALYVIYKAPCLGPWFAMARSPTDLSSRRPAPCLRPDWLNSDRLLPPFTLDTLSH